MSSVDSPYVSEQLSNLSVDIYLLKPFPLDHLLQHIRQVNPKIVTSGDLHRTITNTMIRLGISSNHKGYRYLREAITMVYHDFGIMGSVTKELYPPIAKQFNTTPGCVERAMRNAITVAYNRRGSGEIEKLFNHNHKPSNTEFIALLADQLKVSA
jgi:two-component system response regulator (stage 0 sporulation protein A)